MSIRKAYANANTLDPVFLALGLGPSLPLPTSDLASSSKGQTTTAHGLYAAEAELSHSFSIKETVKFAKLNNLLGIVVNADIALHAPALITTIKESGLILITHGAMNSDKAHVDLQSAHGVDGIQFGGVCRFLTQVNM